MAALKVEVVVAMAIIMATMAMHVLMTIVVVFCGDDTIVMG